MKQAISDSALVREILEEVSRMPLEEVKSDLEMMEPEEVAEKLKMGRSTVYHLANEGKIPATRIGTMVRFRPRALLAFVMVKEKQAVAKAA